MSLISRRQILLFVIFFKSIAPPGLLLAADDKQKKSEKNKDPVYDPGGPILPPKLIHYVEPEFSNSSKEAFVDGMVKISTIITRDGLPTELKVVSGLNADEDRTAVEAVKQWRFKPGTKNGEPVNVRMTVEVSFQLM